MKILRLILKVYDFISAFAYVITKFDEWVEQCKTFWKWLKDDDDDNEKETPRAC